MPSLLVEDFELNYLLGNPQMDATHRVFVEQLNALDSAPVDRFPDLFKALVDHTEEHFDAELKLMTQSAFPATQEHVDEHRRVLGQMHQFAERIRSGRLLMARAYVREQLPGWFKLHAVTMDSALAAHLQQHAQVADTIA